MHHQDTQTLHYRWDQVFSAFWRRYPNPHSKHVLTEDVVDRVVDKDGRLWTKKLLSKTNSAPKWTERFLPTNIVYIIEESIMDLKSRTLTTYTRNIGLKHLLTVEEKVVYRPHEEYHDRWTVSEKRVFVNSTVYGFAYAAKRLGLERYKQNIKKAHKGFTHILEHMYGNHEQAHQLGVAPTIPATQFNHPVLKRKLKEHATMASEFAKSKVPVVVATE